MPTISYTTTDVRTGFFRRTLQDKLVTLKFDGHDVATATIQFMRPGCPLPNFEHYASGAEAARYMAAGGVAYALTYVMLKEVGKTRFGSATIKSAHGGVLGLLNCRFVIVSESRQFRSHGNARRLHQCDMSCSQMELSMGYCAEKLEAKYPGLVFA
jgi:hypothetical protein